MSAPILAPIASGRHCSNHDEPAVVERNDLDRKGRCQPAWCTPCRRRCTRTQRQQAPPPYRRRTDVAER
eukprot:8965338-Alexandrium_andersonii.AAC.1